MTVRNVNGVAVSDHMVRRLALIAEKGALGIGGCRNCTNMSFGRLVDAGLVCEVRSGVYSLTNAGLQFLTDVIGGRT